MRVLSFPVRLEQIEYGFVEPSRLGRLFAKLAQRLQASRLAEPFQGMLAIADLLSLAQGGDHHSLKYVLGQMAVANQRMDETNEGAALGKEGPDEFIRFDRHARVLPLTSQRA